MMLLNLIFKQQVSKQALEVETRYQFYIISMIPCFKYREWDSNPYRITLVRISRLTKPVFS